MFQCANEWSVIVSSSVDCGWCVTVDDSRVKLVPLDDTEDGSDYINANFIPVSFSTVHYTK